MCKYVSWVYCFGEGSAWQKHRVSEREKFLIKVTCTYFWRFLTALVIKLFFHLILLFILICVCFCFCLPDICVFLWLWKLLFLWVIWWLSLSPFGSFLVGLSFVFSQLTPISADQLRRMWLKPDKFKILALDLNSISLTISDIEHIFICLLDLVCSLWKCIYFSLLPIFKTARMAIINKSTNNKCWQGHEEKGTLVHCWLQWRLMQLLWETVWSFLKRLKVDLLYNSVIQLLEIYLNPPPH